MDPVGLIPLKGLGRVSRSPNVTGAVSTPKPTLCSHVPYSLIFCVYYIYICVSNSLAYTSNIPHDHDVRYHLGLYCSQFSPQGASYRRRRTRIPLWQARGLLAQRIIHSPYAFNRKCHVVAEGRLSLDDCVGSALLRCSRSIFRGCRCGRPCWRLEQLKSAPQPMP